MQKFSIYNLLSALGEYYKQKGAFTQKEPTEEKPKEPEKEQRKERVINPNNPLISAIKSHEEFEKRVYKNRDKS